MVCVALTSTASGVAKAGIIPKTPLSSLADIMTGFLPVSN
jgi:hypothetical protein